MRLRRLLMLLWPCWRSPAARGRSRAMPRRRGATVRPSLTSGCMARRSRRPTPSAACAQVVPVAVAFADGPYTLDSGDKLRIVVFGQDALSNNYTVDAQGQVSLPLVGAVEARGLHHRATEQRHRRPAEVGLRPRPERCGRDRDLPAVLRARRGDVPRPVPLRAEHDGRERHRHRRRLHAARREGQGHHHPEDAGRAGPHGAAAAHPIRPGDTVEISERWF